MAPTDETPHGLGASDKKTILIVDDEPMILEIGEHMLSYLGYNVMTANNGKEAVATFQQYRHTIDLIILDVIMPKMSGTETYDQLNTIDTEVKILISSGFGLDKNARKILDKGADEFLLKPFSMEELKNKINKAFAVSTDENQNPPDS